MEGFPWERMVNRNVLVDLLTCNNSWSDDEKRYYRPVYCPCCDGTGYVAKGFIPRSSASVFEDSFSEANLILCEYLDPC